MNLQDISTDFRSKINKEQARELFKVDTKEGFVKFISANQSLFSAMQNSTNEEELSALLFSSLGDMKKLANSKIYEGDLISSQKNDQILKGKVLSETADTYVIDHLSKGETEVPKDKSIKMFSGQKYDIRELNGVFTENQMTKLSVNDIPKSDQIKLLKGEETGVLVLRVSVHNDKEQQIKEEKLRFKLLKNQKENTFKLNVIKAMPDKIYNKQLPEDILKQIKSGSEIKMDFETKEKTFSAVVYWDKELEGLRTKSPSEEINEKKTQEKKNEHKIEKTPKKSLKI